MSVSRKFTTRLFMLFLLAGSTGPARGLLAAGDPENSPAIPDAAGQETNAQSPAPPAAPGPAGAPAPEQTAAGNRAAFFDKWVFGGFVDTYYGYNFNRPASRKDGLRNFDVNHNQFSLSLLELSVLRQPDPLGFRVDLNFGDIAKMVHAAEPGGSDVFQYLQQAYLSYKAPLGKGLSIDFGKFVTQHGAEVIKVKDNYNYSRSLLFSWAIPYYHMGGRARYTFSDKFEAAAYVVNGWNNVVDNNAAKTYGFQAVLNPTKKLNIVQNYMAGPEQNNDTNEWRHLWDTTVTYTFSPSFSMMANYDYGMDRQLGSRVRWQGIAGYARVQVTPWFAVSPRLEWYGDPQGFTTSLAQNVKEATFTTEFKVKDSLLLRAEYRQDWSNRPFFERHDNSLSKNQQTATIGIVYILGHEH